MFPDKFDTISHKLDSRFSVRSTITSFTDIFLNGNFSYSVIPGLQYVTIYGWIFSEEL